LRPAAANRRKWLLSIVGGVAVVAASVAIVVYSFSGGPAENMAKVEAKGEGEEGKGSVEPLASEFVRTLSSTQENEAVVVRVKLTKDAIRGRMLDEALKAHGIQLATADVSNEASRKPLPLVVAERPTFSSWKRMLRTLKRRSTTWRKTLSLKPPLPVNRWLLPSAKAR
jgi:hypothetical protein